MKDSLAAAAAAAAADLSVLAGKTDVSFARLRERSEGLAAQQKKAQEQQARLAGECLAMQQVGADSHVVKFGAGVRAVGEE
jgi:hypothetical protein